MRSQSGGKGWKEGGGAEGRLTPGAAAAGGDHQHQHGDDDDGSTDGKEKKPRRTMSTVDSFICTACRKLKVRSSVFCVCMFCCM